jgi:hypothetical protein
MPGFDALTDIVQTAAIVVLTIVIAVAVWRGYKRFSLQNGVIQDAILSQYEILRQLGDSKAELRDIRAQIDELAHEMRERWAKIETRVHRLEDKNTVWSRDKRI